MEMQKSCILLVDDENFYLDVLIELLSDDYQITVAKSGKQALKRANVIPPPDLILLDVLLPDIDGYEVCRRLGENPDTAGIPVIFLTVMSEVEDEIKGFELGAVDYITKPISPPIVRSRVKTHLSLIKARRALENQNQLLERLVQERTSEISRTQDVAIFCMASLAETRDGETGNHIHRTQHYVRLLSEYLKDRPGYKDQLDAKNIELLFKSAPLHDIGKVGVPDRILLKPGKLSQTEWEEMKKHTLYGHEALLRAEEEQGSTSFLKVAREVVISHHERWDGQGYPAGCRGEEIPVSGRLMALADVYDALISKRVYKPSFSHENATSYILEQRGAQFDPVVVDAFQDLQEDFHKIARQFPDA